MQRPQNTGSPRAPGVERQGLHPLSVCFRTPAEGARERRRIQFLRPTWGTDMWGTAGLRSCPTENTSCSLPQESAWESCASVPLTTESASLGPIASAPLYASGHLLFLDGGLMVQRFDVESLRRVGESLPLITEAAQTGSVRSFSVSDTGMLVYREPTTLASQLTWLDRGGRPVATVGDPGSFGNLALNRDETRVAVSKGAGQGFDIWVLDLTRTGDSGFRLTTHPAGEFDPAWSSDGKFVVFNSNRQKGYGSCSGVPQMAVAKMSPWRSCRRRTFSWSPTLRPVATP